MSSMSSRFPRPGEYIELMEDVGPIPRGIYKLSDIDPYSLAVQLGGKVAFAIIGCGRKLIRKVPKSRGILRRTTLNQFLDRYYRLLEIEKEKPAVFMPHKPVTMCFVDPSVAREVN